MKNKLIYILTNPISLSLILTIAFLLSLPPLFSKYEISLIKKERTSSFESIQYCDLNNDGYSEQVTIIKTLENHTGIIVREKGTIINQWSFNGNLNSDNLFFGDFNNDGLKEIFLFTTLENKIG